MSHLVDHLLDIFVLNCALVSFRSGCGFAADFVLIDSGFLLFSRLILQ